MHGKLSRVVRFLLGDLVMFAWRGGNDSRAKKVTQVYMYLFAVTKIVRWM